MKKALAFDIGGTKIYSTIVDENGQISGQITKFNTPKTLDEIKTLLKTQISKFEKDVTVLILYNISSAIPPAFS